MRWFLRHPVYDRLSLQNHRKPPRYFVKESTNMESYAIPNLISDNLLTMVFNYCCLFFSVTRLNQRRKQLFPIDFPRVRKSTSLCRKPFSNTSTDVKQYVRYDLTTRNAFDWIKFVELHQVFWFNYYSILKMFDQVPCETSIDLINLIIECTNKHRLNCVPLSTRVILDFWI